MLRNQRWAKLRLSSCPLFPGSPPVLANGQRCHQHSEHSDRKQRGLATASHKSILSNSDRLRQTSCGKETRLKNVLDTGLQNLSLPHVPFPQFHNMGVTGDQ